MDKLLVYDFSILVFAPFLCPHSLASYNILKCPEVKESFHNYENYCYMLRKVEQEEGRDLALMSSLSCYPKFELCNPMILIYETNICSAVGFSAA